MINIKRDILIKINWIQKTGTIMTEKEIEFNVLKNEISK